MQGKSNDVVRPFDPAVSVYPLAMSARRARHEAKQARRYRLALPKGHPYRWLPLWVPFGLAKVMSHSDFQG